MKKIDSKIVLLIAGAIVLILGLFLVVSQLQPDGKQPGPCSNRAIQSKDKIWVISDTHFISDTLYDDGEKFQFIKKTAAGKDLDYQNERMEALVWQVEKERPALLLVSGDLTLNGEKASIEELATYFKRIKKLGTAVYVIPGNHDIADGWAKKYQGDKMEPTEQIMAQEFATIFAEMGFEDAISRDKNSLSYAVQPFSNVLLVMLDTNKYMRTESSSTPTTSGVIRPQTLKWLEEMLVLGAERGATVIPVMHHNLVNHNEYLNKGFTLDNAEEIRELFAKYGVTVTLSGHIHAQDIASQTVAKQRLYDIATGSFAILSNSIGELKIKQEQLTYTRQTLKMEEWAHATKQTDANLLAYSSYSDKLFRKDGEGMAYRQMFEENWYDKAIATEIAKFVGEVNVRFFDGRDYSENEAEITQLQRDEGYRLLAKQSDSFLLNYVESIIRDQDIADTKVVIKLNTEKD